MKQMRIGTSHASIDIKQNITILPQKQTVSLLYYFENILFLSKLYVLCSSAYKRYGFVTSNL